MVLAAGAGRRLAPYTDTLPKTLVPVDGDRTILDIALGNLAAAGLDRVVVVTGYAAGAIEERRAALEERHGVTLELVFNPKAEEWNNAYSLWCARDHFGEGVLLINGDTVHPPSVEETLLAARGPDILLALDDVKPLAEEEMKVHVSPEGRMTRINKAIDPATAQGEYIGLALIEAGRRAPARRRARGDVHARSPALLRGRLPGVLRPRRARRHRADRRRRLGGGRRPPRPRARAGDRLPLLTRMIGAPLHVDIGPGTVAQLAPLLADRRISSGGHVAVVVGSGPGRARSPTRCAPTSRTPTSGRWTTAAASARRTRSPSGCAPASTTRVVGIGGGRTLDVAKLASTLSGLPMVAVATSLAHDGLASPVASLEEGGRKGSYGVQMPLALVVDLDYVRRSDPAMRRSGIGDAISNLAAIADWRLAGRRARRAGGRARGDVRADRGEGDPAPHGRDRRRGLPRRARRGARALRHRDGDGRLEPARAAAATTRSCTRSTTSSPARRATASWPAPRRCSPPFLRGDDEDGRGRRRLPDAPRPAAPARRPRADRGAVRAGGASTRRARGRTGTRSWSTSRSTSGG